MARSSAGCKKRAHWAGGAQIENIQQKKEIRKVLKKRLVKAIKNHELNSEVIIYIC